MVAALTDRSTATRDEAPPPHRLHPHPLGQAVRLGQVQWPHPRHEGSCRLRPGRDLPRLIDITHANVNDAQIGRTVEAEPGLTYVFDKGYCHYGWWSAVHAAKAFFVTRPKHNMRLRVVAERQSEPSPGDGFVVTSDQAVVFASKGDSKLAMPLRRIRVRRHLDGKTINVITNDMTRSSLEVAKAYKLRWQIELLFRWLKQHLKLRTFMGTSETRSNCKSSPR